MERRDDSRQIFNVLASGLRGMIREHAVDISMLQEIRLRTAQPVMIVYGGEEKILPDIRQPHIVTRDEMRETMDYISHYSLYAYSNELKQGFVTIEGGHRVGVAGKVITEQDKVKNIQYISSVNIRISHEVIGCSDRRLLHVADCAGCRTGSRRSRKRKRRMGRCSVVSKKSCNDCLPDS